MSIESMMPSNHLILCRPLFLPPSIFPSIRERPFPKKRNAKKQNGCVAQKRREAKGKGEKERYTHLNAEFQRIAQRDKKALLSDQCKEIEEKIEWERLEVSSRKLEIPREHFMQR